MSSNAIRQADAVALTDRIGELLACLRSAEAEIGALLVEIEHRGVLELFGYRSAVRLFEHLADVPKQAAERVVKRARALNPGRNLDGTHIPALAPATGFAARSWRLSTPMFERRHKQVAALGARIVAHLDPDGWEPDSTGQSKPDSELSLRRKRTGAWESHGKFDDETGTRAAALLDSLAQRRSDEEGQDSGSPRERYSDAFSDAVDLASNSPDLPMQAGERAHVMVAVSLEDLKTGTGTATLGDTGEMSAAEARIHACDSIIIPAVLGTKSEPLDLGRPHRLISAGLRRALYPRDRGCSFPAAPGHPGIVKVLHRSGWEVRIAADGLPEFLDRRLKPRRNNVHQPLTFAA